MPGPGEQRPEPLARRSRGQIGGNQIGHATNSALGGNGLAEGTAEGQCDALSEEEQTHQRQQQRGGKQLKGEAPDAAMRRDPAQHHVRRIADVGETAKDTAPTDTAMSVIPSVPEMAGQADTSQLKETP